MKLPRSGENLPADQEWDEDVQHILEIHLTADQIVLVAAIGVARRVGVVFVEEDVSFDAFLMESDLGGALQIFDDAFPGLVVGDQIV